MLTGKAKSDFEKWYWNDWLTGSDRDYYEKDEVIENSWKAEKLFLFPLIIEWLDSVGIYVENTYSISYDDSISFHALVNKVYVSHEYKSMPINIFPDRTQATEEAIIKSNEIYNSQ